jgi:hypothetical protein
MVGSGAGLDPAAALLASLEPLMDQRVAALVEAGEGRPAAKGSLPRIPATRLVWSLMDWVDRCLAAGFGLRAVRDAIVLVAERRVEGFKLGYGTLKVYRVHYGKQMQGGAKGRMHAETGAAPSPSLMPSPAAAEAARSGQPAEVGRGVGGRIEKVVVAVGYGAFGTGVAGLQRARLAFRAASVVVDVIGSTARRAVSRALGGAAEGAARRAAPVVEAAAKIGGFIDRRPLPPVTVVRPGFGAGEMPKESPEELRRLHFEEVDRKDRAFAKRAFELIAERQRELQAKSASKTR